MVANLKGGQPASKGGGRMTPPAPPLNETLVPVRYRPNAVRSKVNDHLGDPSPGPSPGRGPAPLWNTQPRVQPEKYGRQGSLDGRASSK